MLNLTFVDVETLASGHVPFSDGFVRRPGDDERVCQRDTGHRVLVTSAEKETADPI